MLTKEEKAVIIGLYRQGAKTETIMWVLNIPYVTIDKWVSEYIDKLPK